MSITPTLCAMLQDQLLCERYVRHLDLLIDLAAREQSETAMIRSCASSLIFISKCFAKHSASLSMSARCDLLASFSRTEGSGAVEIIASAATHGLLPLLLQQSREAARAQILIGRDIYVELFGAGPTAFGCLSALTIRASNLFCKKQTTGRAFGTNQRMFASCRIGLRPGS